MNYYKITYPDVNNGLGFRVTLWTCGCTIHCPGCHNKELWDFSIGKRFTEDTRRILFDLVRLDYIKGLTICGGEPLNHIDEITDLLKHFKEEFKDSKDVWLYTGYNYDKIKDCSALKYVDTLVEGPYIQELRTTTQPFIGSSNQNIIKLN